MTIELKKRTVYLLDVILILVCALGFYQVYEKPGLPIKFKENGLVVAEVLGSASSQLLIGDRIISINDQKVFTLDELEFVLDAKSIGENVKVILQRNAASLILTEKLIHFYSMQYVVIQIAVVIIFFFLAIFVFTRAPNDIDSNLFHWSIIFAALLISTTWGKYSIESFGSGQIVRVMFSAAYAFAPMFFLHFTFVFPNRKSKHSKIIMQAFYSLGGIIVIGSGYGFIKASLEYNLQAFRIYDLFFDVCRILFVICVVVGISNIVHSYIKTEKEYERRKLRWIILGLLIGPLCLVLLWIIPQLFASNGLIDEEYILLAMLSVPITFAISIVKYHILNVDQIFRRGTVYIIVLFFVFLIYVLVSSALSFFIGIAYSYNSFIASSIAAIIISASFQPIREATQKFVDKRFFHVRYNFRIAEKLFIEKIKYCCDEATLAEKILEEFNKIIPCDGLCFVVIHGQEKICYVRDAEVPSYKKLDYVIDSLCKSKMLLALSEDIELGSKYKEADKILFNALNISVALPVFSESRQVIAALLAGKKKSGFRFILEDIDLMETYSHNIGVTLDRIGLNERLINERIESQRLKEMNEVKSYFVSSVTHELKTPLTSIKMFAEMLEDSKLISRAKQNEYCKIIRGETNRLSRLIDNVLNATKIEKGIKDYNFSVVNLAETVRQAVETMSYQLEMNCFEYVIDIANEKIEIIADKDAVEEIIINLISNSIKYSKDKKHVLISAKVNGDDAELEVQDEGIGIAEKALEKIFNPYERSADVKSIPGLGLGLALVKHIADAHDAKIFVESSVGKGSSFKISFSLYKGNEDEKNSNY